MDPSKRKCLKTNEDLKLVPEVKLEVFKNYSRRACLLECTARTIYHRCKCLPYYYPDFSKLWKKSTNCNFEGLRCVADYAGKI